MLIAVGSLTVMGAALGTVLGLAARYFAVEGDPLEAEIAGMLPGSQCGQCGFVGCGQYAAALAKGEAVVTACAPGGKPVAEQLAKRLGVSVDLSNHAARGPEVAFVVEDRCIGCLRCMNECSTDAIVGAPKQMHTVIGEFCHACRKCFNVCPTEAIEMRPIPVTVGSWYWQKPGQAQAH
jgi:Na+-translocating ferredoxin:NAD+ oxidoreductase subunit B